MTTGKRFFAVLFHCCLLLFTTSGEVIESSHSGNLELTFGVYEIERSKADEYLQSIADDDQCMDGKLYYVIYLHFCDSFLQ